MLYLTWSKPGARVAGLLYTLAPYPLLNAPRTGVMAIVSMRHGWPDCTPLELDRVTKLVHGGGFALDLETRIHRTFGTGGIDELVCAGIADRLTAE